MSSTGTPSLPPGVELVAGDLDHLVVDTAHSRAVIYLQGAHVATWQPRGQDPVLFLSRAAHRAPGRSIRGGVPVCFPWVGKGPARDKHPGHGFARVRPWRLVDVRAEAGAVVVVLELHDDEVTRESVWPHPFAARYEVRVGRVLSLSLQVRNTGEEPVTFEESLHTYLAVDDVARTRVEGLTGRDYVDGFGGGAAGRQDGPVRVTGAADLVFRDDGAELALVDEARGRRVRLRTRRSRSTIVWNPGPEFVTSLRDMADDEWPQMLCVQSANVTDDAVTLAPGQRHTLELELAVAAAD